MVACFENAAGARKTLLYAIAFSLFGGVPATSSADSIDPRMRCGPNALYMFMIISGRRDVTLEMCESLPGSASGTSMLALRDAANRFGVPSVVRRYSIAEVDSVPLPAIGQFHTGLLNPINLYHFNVIYNVDAHRVYVIDGTTGARRTILRDRLHRMWTGVAMSQDHPRWPWRLDRRVSAAHLLMVDFAILFSLLAWRRTYVAVQRN